MDRATIEPAIRIVLAVIHSKLNEATRIAKAAEAGRPQDAASLLNRLSRE